jgi:hypothetical protein
VHVIFRQIGNLSPATQLAVIRELERAALVLFVQTRIGKSNVKLKDITDKGWAFLDKPVPGERGKGGIKHRHWAHWAYAWAVERGYEQCTIEPRVPGTTHFGDVGFRAGGILHIVQVIAHCDSNIIDHVRAALVESHSVDVLTFVTPLKSQWDDIRARILTDPQLAFCIDHVHFDVVETYLKGLWS